jgi:hypothetical protein
MIEYLVEQTHLGQKETEVIGLRTSVSGLTLKRYHPLPGPQWGDHRAGIPRRY